MIEDSELLRRYVEDRSQAAFSELVQRRVNLVYSVALRQVGGDAHLAEDVTQKVFADLARKASSLMTRPVLSGWLYRSAQYAGTDVVRSERRRRAREQQTQLMNDPTHQAGERAEDWEKLRPVLDEAMADLSDDDRDAVALRFFEERPFADIGYALRLSEDTARKRVERALDKLHAALSKRGVTSTTGALGLALANQVAVAAPSGLAASITGAAFSAAAAGGSIGAGALQTLFTGKTILGSLGAVALIGLGTAIYQAGQTESPVEDVPAPDASALVASPKPDSRPAPTTVSRTNLDQATTPTSALIAPARPPAPPARATTIALPPEAQAVQDRYQRAQTLAKNGQHEEALREYIWCLDEGMVVTPSFVGVRSSFLLSSIAELAKSYPPALALLQERRELAERQVTATPPDLDSIGLYIGLNRNLGDDARSLALLDQFSPGDARRSRFERFLFQPLADRGRYADALRARPYADMIRQFENDIQRSPDLTGQPNAEYLRQTMIRSTLRTALKNIEVLAGAGDLDHAKEHIARVLAVDGSTEFKTLLRPYLQRAGHPELLAP